MVIIITITIIIIINKIHATGFFEKLIVAHLTKKFPTLQDQKFRYRVHKVPPLDGI